jgi:hypothetical protein
MVMSQMKTLKMRKKIKTPVFAAVDTASHQHGLEARRSAVCGRSDTVLKNYALLKLFLLNLASKDF